MEAKKTEAFTITLDSREAVTLHLACVAMIGSLQTKFATSFNPQEKIAIASTIQFASGLSAKLQALLPKPAPAPAKKPDAAATPKAPVKKPIPNKKD